MEINYDYYRIFYYVAKYKSFTQAANILLNNQPNITRSMNNLENQLGCRLFIRSNRGVTLTPEGERLFYHVSIAYRQLQMAEVELGRGRGAQSGLVTIGASETALHELLLSKLSEFHSLFPRVRIRITNFSTPQAVDALKKGLVDFAVVTSPTGSEAPFRETPLKHFREVLTGGSQYSFLAGSPKHLAELSDYPLVCLGKATKTYEFYHQFYQSLGLTLLPDVEAATADQLLPLIRNNLGIGFISEKLAVEALASGEIVKIPLIETMPSRCICLVEDTSRPLSLCASQLAKLLCGGNEGSEEKEPAAECGGKSPKTS